MTHYDNILNHLKQNGTITSMQAIMTYGCTRLSAVIFNLRKDGHSITSINKSGTHHVTGKKTTYAVYHYGGKVDEQATMFNQNIHP